MTGVRKKTRAALFAAAFAVVMGPACSQGNGTGSASGELDVPDCWTGPFDLKPDFFAAVPSGDSFGALQIRIQSGGDYESFSDGIAILVDDVGEIRGDPDSYGPRPSLLGKSLIVGLSPNVTPPGVPVVAVANPPIVHASLYLERTCRTQNLALYAMSAVTLNPDGTCIRPASGETPPACGSPAIETVDAGTDASADASMVEAGLSANADAAVSLSGDASSNAAADAAMGTDAEGGTVSTAPQIGTSTIVFSSLFDGDPSESDASNRLTDAQFEFYFADPREICAGGVGPPPRCRGHLTGHFRFYFERGQPAQPFP